MAKQNRAAADSSLSQKRLSYTNAKMFNVSKDFNFSFGPFNEIPPYEWVVTKCGK